MIQSFYSHQTQRKGWIHISNHLKPFPSRKGECSSFLLSFDASLKFKLAISHIANHEMLKVLPHHFIPCSLRWDSTRRYFVAESIYWHAESSVVSTTSSSLCNKLIFRNSRARSTSSWAFQKWHECAPCSALPTKSARFIPGWIFIAPYEDNWNIQTI